jgi:DNA polymerase III, delta subunit
VSLAVALDAARGGRLYPSVILHGRDAAARQAAAVTIARTLLCDVPPPGRPCGVCRHCRRIVWPGAQAAGSEAPFHPDVQILERDLKTATSVEATRDLLRMAQVSPFEARGQVFVIASAETLSGEAANALLKNLEEPHVSAPRHFLLLAPAAMDLLPTLRSRSLAVFLGPAEPVDAAVVEPIARAFAAAAAAWAQSGAAIHLLAAADALSAAGGWEDPRAARPWATAAAAVVRSLEIAPDSDPVRGPAERRARLALCEALLGAPALRLRAVPAERILEGLVARHLAP